MEEVFLTKQHQLSTVIIKICGLGSDKKLQYKHAVKHCPAHFSSQSSTILSNITQPESGGTILKDIVDKYKQCGQHNIGQSCFNQLSKR